MRFRSSWDEQSAAALYSQRDNLMADDGTSEFNFAISLSVLNHLGRNLYRNFITVLGEAISNSWDAEAKNVWISFDKANNSFFVKDDGKGMDAEDFQTKFLKIGYSKRKELGAKSDSGRPFIGAKGIGKLALLSCADRITIFTRNDLSEDYVGGVIDNSGLDAAITNDLEPGQYQLEVADEQLLNGKADDHETGTIIVFEGAERILRTSEDQIRKLLALSFHFSLLDDNFTIHVNGDPVGLEDLEALTSKTEFVWKINSYDEKFAESFVNLKEQVDAPDTDLDVTGFIATVEKPSDLNIRGKGERATVDLFVNGRLREKNIISHLPSQRIVESYVYGQIHFNGMDGDGDSPFTSSREGVVADDENFQALIAYLADDLFSQVIAQWDDLRWKYKQEGDDENPKRTKKQRRAAGLVNAAENELTKGIGGAQGDLVDSWVNAFRNDANFNVECYVDCFLSENLVRKYMAHASIDLTEPAQKLVTDYRDKETKALEEANINFDLRSEADDLNYLDMRALAINAEGAKHNQQGKPTPLFKSSIDFKPARDAMSHTALLTQTAKDHLSLTFQNIVGRIRNLLKEMEV